MLEVEGDLCGLVGTVNRWDRTWEDARREGGLG